MSEDTCVLLCYVKIWNFLQILRVIEGLKVKNDLCKLMGRNDQNWTPHKIDFDLDQKQYTC